MAEVQLKYLEIKITFFFACVISLCIKESAL